MYSAVDPLMCMVIFMQLRDLWFGRSAPDAPIDASLLASRMANVADGLLDVIRGIALSACSTFPSTFPFALAASESLPWYSGLHLEPLPDPDQYHRRAQGRARGISRDVLAFGRDGIFGGRLFLFFGSWELRAWCVCVCVCVPNGPAPGLPKVVIGRDRDAWLL